MTYRNDVALPHYNPMVHYETHLQVVCPAAVRLWYKKITRPHEAAPSNTTYLRVKYQCGSEF
jgi:hypothetical protein